MMQKSVVLGFSFLVLLASLAAVSAMQPITVPLEVRNNTNGILNNTQLTINFTFFDELTTGTLLYNETQTLITDSNGRLFPIINTTGLPGNTTVWLEINISNQMITPRFRITGTLYAKNAERLQNQTRTTLSIGNFTTSNLTLQGNLTHNLGGVLINTTGGINASAVGFGSVPQGVLDIARTWSTTQIFTALQNFTSSTAHGNITIIVGGILNHSVGGLLVNNTGGVNASAVGFGSIPQGVLDTIRNWTAGQIFGQINLTGRVNISAPLFTSGNISSSFGGLLINETGGINASAVGFGTIPDAVLSTNVALLSAIQTFTNKITINPGANGGPSLVLRAATGGITHPLSILEATSGISVLNITAAGELQIQNITHFSNRAIIINNTGFVNASAVLDMTSDGTGKLPKDTLPLFVNGSLTPMTRGAIIQIGNAISTSASDTVPTEVLVNLSNGFTCTYCYSVAITFANYTGTNITGSVIARNASMFNVTFTTKGAINFTYIAIGY